MPSGHEFSKFSEKKKKKKNQFVTALLLVSGQKCMSTSKMAFHSFFLNFFIKSDLSYKRGAVTSSAGFKKNAAFFQPKSFKIC